MSPTTRYTEETEQAFACFNGRHIGMHHQLQRERRRGSGGGIYCQTGIIASCEIRKTLPLLGSRWLHAGANTTIQSCVIADNRSEGGEGGVMGDSLTITGCTNQQSNLTAAMGGIGGSNLQVSDCVITGNSGLGTGGIEVTSSSIIRLHHQQQLLREGGAGGLSGTDTQVIQTILWGNTSTHNPQGHEVVGANLTLTCCDLDPSGVSGSITYLGPQVYSDPLFCAPEPCRRATSREGTILSDPTLPAYLRATTAIS